VFCPFRIRSSSGGRAHIPTSRDRKLQRSVDHLIYRKRNLIERFFNKLKHFRRIATRYDKTARNFLAAVLIAATRLWARFESATLLLQVWELQQLLPSSQSRAGVEEPSTASEPASCIAANGATYSITSAAVASMAAGTSMAGQPTSSYPDGLCNQA
jgi:DDE family transposase